jgi:hypothetical protein
MTRRQVAAASAPSVRVRRPAARMPPPLCALPPRGRRPSGGKRAPPPPPPAEAWTPAPCPALRPPSAASHSHLWCTGVFSSPAQQTVINLNNPPHRYARRAWRLNHACAADRYPARPAQTPRALSGRRRECRPRCSSLEAGHDGGTGARSYLCGGAGARPKAGPSRGKP